MRPSRPVSRRSLVAVLTGATLFGFAACGGDDSSGSSGSSDGFSVVGGLAQLPESTLADGYIIQTADLAAASELAGLDRPDPDADFDEASDWLLHIDGVLPRGEEPAIVSGLLPEAANRQYLQQIDEFRDEVGWSVLDVDHYVEVYLAPDRFTVMSGEFDRKALDRALGDPDGGIWSIGGDEDYKVSIADRSAARPLGEALRFAEQDGRLAVSKSTPQIEDWIEGGDTVADHDDVRAVAQALDDQGVYSALILDGDRLVAGGEGLTPEQQEEIEDQALDPFAVLGVGLTLDDGQPRAVFVYQYRSEQAAADAADGIEAAFEDGVSFQIRAPISDFFEHPEVTVDGSTVTVVVDLADDRPAGRVWSFAGSRDIITSHT